VLDAMAATDALAPPDHQDGDATFAWAFALGGGVSSTSGATGSVGGASTASGASPTPASAGDVAPTAMSFSAPAGCPGAGMTKHAIPSGPICSWSKACPNDDPLDASDHAQCEKTLADPKCGALAKAVAVCAFAYTVCGPNGKLDDKATEPVVTGACGMCKQSYDAFNACTGGK
jgi:hypothetical protein